MSWVYKGNLRSRGLSGNPPTTLDWGESHLKKWIIISSQHQHLPNFSLPGSPLPAPFCPVIRSAVLWGWLMLNALWATTQRPIVPCKPASLSLCSLSTSNCSAQAEYLEREAEDKRKRQEEGDFAAQQYWWLFIIGKHWLLYERGSFTLE